MARPKKTKPSLENVEQLDGKFRDVRNLDDIFGTQETCRYSTKDTDEYSQQLNEMNGTDLGREAGRCGLAPNLHDLPKLRKTLVREHQRYFSTYQSLGRVQRIDPTASSMSKDIKKILSEGR